MARSLRGPCFFCVLGSLGTGDADCHGRFAPSQWQGFYKGCGGRRDTWVPPYSRTFCRAGPVCPAGGTAQDRRADRGVHPYGCIAGSACKRGVGDAAPYGGLQGVRKKNPPVTALPCQPPLGKGAMETGDADCHSQCAHWLRNDMFFTRGQCKAGRRGGGTPPYGV